MKLLLKNCRLIPQLSDGYETESGAVLIKNGKIEKIYDCSGDWLLEERCRMVDCQGRTLLPGLFDAHTHLNYDYYNGILRLNDFKLLVNSCLTAKRFLDFGITTIRDMGSAKGHAAYVKEAIQRGLFLGPNIVTAGTILCPVCRRSVPDPNAFIRYFSGIDDLVRQVREEAGDGADFIKLYGQGEPPEILEEEMEAAVRIAHRLGRKIAVHAHDASSIHMSLKAGVDTIEHGSFIREEDIQILKAGETYLVPTLSILSPDVPMPGTTPEQKLQMLQPLLEANAENIGRAYREGLVLGFGTDVDIKDFGETAGVEFKMRKEYCGMKNIDMLLQATKYSAKICGLEAVTGEIKEGLAADLILVEGNPDEDISVMYKKPERVWISGREHHPQ